MTAPHNRSQPDRAQATLEQRQDLQRRAGTPHLPTQLTYVARLAVGREGPRGYDWEDKPHRIVYDLCREIEATAALRPTPADGAREAVPVAWMSSADLSTFAIDRERYPGGGAGDLATARYMKVADFFDVPLYAHLPPVDARREREAALDWLAGFAREARPFGYVSDNEVIDKFLAAARAALQPGDVKP